MLNIKKAAEQLTASGIIASEQDVIRWINEGVLKAEVSQRRNTTYKINMFDLTQFIIQKHSEKLTAQLEQSHREKLKLAEEIEILNTRIHIEESKVRTLKKMLNTQIEEIGPTAVNYGDLLGLENEPSSQSLKKEFKKLLKSLHPDRGGDERLFKVFNEHYENLKS